MIKSYTIGKHFLSSLFYADSSGLSEDDTDLITAFIEDIGNGTVEVVEGSESFERCDVTGLKSDTVDILIYYFERSK